MRRILTDWVPLRVCRQRRARHAITGPGYEFRLVRQLDLCADRPHRRLRVTQEIFEANRAEPGSLSTVFKGNTKRVVPVLCGNSELFRVERAPRWWLSAY